MEIEIAAMTYVKTLLAFAAAVVFHPMIFIIRDALIWRAIRHFYLNNETKQIIARLAREEIEQQEKFQYGTRLTSDNEGKDIYYIEDREVSEMEYKKYRRQLRDNREAIVEYTNHVNSKAQQAKWIIKHFKLDIENPVEELLAAHQEEAKNPSRPKHLVEVSLTDTVAACEAITESQKKV